MIANLTAAKPDTILTPLHIACYGGPHMLARVLVGHDRPVQAQDVPPSVFRPILFELRAKADAALNDAVEGARPICWHGYMGTCHCPSHSIPQAVQHEATARPRHPTHRSPVQELRAANAAPRQLEPRSCGAPPGPAVHQPLPPPLPPVLQEDAAE